MMLASIFTSVRFCFRWHGAEHHTDSERSEEEVRTAKRGGGAHSEARRRCAVQGTRRCEIHKKCEKMNKIRKKSLFFPKTVIFSITSGVM